MSKEILSLDEIKKKFQKQEETFNNKKGEYSVEIYRNEEGKIVYAVPGFGLTLKTTN